MLLGDFIKELKHNSLNIKLLDINTSREPYLFNGTLGTLKNNIHYQDEWNKCKICDIEALYNEDMKTSLEICIYLGWKRENEKYK